MLNQRKSAALESLAANLSDKQNRNSLMREVSGAKKRKLGKKCALDPTRRNEFIQYYATTFGGLPLGQQQKRLHTVLPPK